MRAQPIWLIAGLSMFGAMLALGNASWAQTAAPQTPATTTAPEPTSQSPLQKPPKNEGIPPCPTAAEQNDALSKQTASGTEKAAAQPGERSGVLPNAVGPGTDVSAAPTVQTDGSSVRSPMDCPLVPGHPNALTPGPKTVPEPSNKPK